MPHIIPYRNHPPQKQAPPAPPRKIQMNADIGIPTVTVGEFVTLEGIEILKTGIDYPASTGNVSITSEMIQEIIDMQADPHIVPPRIKIAHADNPINDDLQALFESVNVDSAAETPALGTILNMRSADDGQTLIGDWYGLPSWLAAIVETAYPARSIEGGSWKNEANGKEYGYRLTAVSLLGVCGPGCTSLDDLQVLFSKEGPKVTVIEMDGRSTNKRVGKSKILAQTNVEDIRRAFYEEFAQGDRFWWWDREMLINPDEFIVEDPDAGELWRLPFTLGDGDGPLAVTFGDLSPIKIEYVPRQTSQDEAAGKALMCISAQLEGSGMLLAVNHNPPRESERANRPKEGSKMRISMEVDIPGLRERLNLTEEQLPDDATEEQVSAALGNPVGGGDPSPPEPKEDPAPTPAPEPADPPKPEGALAGAVTMPAETLAQLQADAKAGREARADQVKAERDDYMSKVVKAGKIPPSAKQAYRDQLEQGGDVEKTTRTFLDGMASGLLPVGEEETGGDSLDGATTEYPDTHLTEDERSRIAAHAAGTVVKTRIVTEA